MIRMFPVAGQGRRFVEAGYTLPKVLLPLQDHPLLWWAVNATTGLGGTTHYIPHLELALEPRLQGVLPHGCWHVELERTPGPLQTVWNARGCLQTEEELLLCDGDSFMDAQELVEAVEVFRKSRATGGVTVRKTTDPMCSYVEVDAQWWVSQTREKDPFTTWSSTGPYWFRSAKQFLLAAEKAMKAQHVSIAPVYNYLEGKVKAMPVSTFQHLGSPEAYERACQHQHG